MNRYKKSKNLAFSGVLFVLTVALVTACNELGDDWQHGHISGPTDSGWYPMSTLFADIWLDEIEEDVDVTVVEGAGVGNIRDVNTGEDVQTGLAFESDFYDALEGEEEFEGDPQENVTTLGAIYPTFWNVAVLEDSPYESLEDVVEHGADVIPGEAGHASTVAFNRIFEAMGYEEDDLEEVGISTEHGNYGDAANQMRDGIIDMCYRG